MILISIDHDCNQCHEIGQGRSGKVKQNLALFLELGEAEQKHQYLNPLPPSSPEPESRHCVEPGLLVAANPKRNAPNQHRKTQNKENTKEQEQKQCTWRAWRRKENEQQKKTKYHWQLSGREKIKKRSCVKNGVPPPEVIRFGSLSPAKVFFCFWVWEKKNQKREPQMTSSPPCPQNVSSTGHEQWGPKGWGCPELGGAKGGEGQKRRGGTGPCTSSQGTCIPREIPHHETVKPVPTSHTNTQTHHTPYTTHHKQQVKVGLAKVGFDQSRFSPKSVLTKVGFDQSRFGQSRERSWAVTASLSKMMHAESRLDWKLLIQMATCSSPRAHHHRTWLRLWSMICSTFQNHHNFSIIHRRAASCGAKDRRASTDANPGGQRWWASVCSRGCPDLFGQPRVGGVWHSQWTNRTEWWTSACFFPCADVACDDSSSSCRGVRDQPRIHEGGHSTGPSGVLFQHQWLRRKGLHTWSRKDLRARWSWERRNCSDTDTRRNSEVELALDAPQEEMGVQQSRSSQLICSDTDDWSWWVGSRNEDAEVVNELRRDRDEADTETLQSLDEGSIVSGDEEEETEMSTLKLEVHEPVRMATGDPFQSLDDVQLGSEIRSRRFSCVLGVGLAKQVDFHSSERVLSIATKRGWGRWGSWRRGHWWDRTGGERTNGTFNNDMANEMEIQTNAWHRFLLPCSCGVPTLEKCSAMWIVPPRHIHGCCCWLGAKLREQHEACVRSVVKTLSLSFWVGKQQFPECSWDFFENAISRLFHEPLPWPFIVLQTLLVPFFQLEIHKTNLAIMSLVTNWMRKMAEDVFKILCPICAQLLKVPLQWKKEPFSFTITKLTVLLFFCVVSCLRAPLPWRVSCRLALLLCFPCLDCLLDKRAAVFAAAAVFANCSSTWPWVLVLVLRAFRNSVLRSYPSMQSFGTMVYDDFVCLHHTPWFCALDNFMQHMTSGLCLQYVSKYCFWGKE